MAKTQERRQFLIKTKDGALEWFDADVWDRSDEALMFSTIDGRLNGYVRLDSIMWFKDYTK